MKRLLLPALLAVSLAACTVRQYEPERPAYTPPATEPAAEIVAPSSSSAPVEQWKEVILTDRTFERAVGVKGMDWLKAIGTVRVEGQMKKAELVIELTRGAEDDGKGWSAIGAYFAPLATRYAEDGTKLFDYPDETTYGTRLHFLDAEWRGDCHRHVAPSSSFGVLKEHDNSTTLDFAAVPMTKDDDGCETGQKKVNMLDIVNDTGLVIGFMPSDTRYHGKVTLRYIGEATVTPF